MPSEVPTKDKAKTVRGAGGKEQSTLTKDNDTNSTNESLNKEHLLGDAADEDTEATNRHTYDFTGRAREEGRRYKEELQQVVVPTVEVGHEAIGLMERLDLILRNATKKKDKGKGGDGAVVQQSSTRTGEKSNMRRKIKATVFTNTASREKSFPRPTGKYGRYVPPNYMFEMVGLTKKLLCAHVLLYFWYKLTQSEQDIATKLFKGLEKIDKARQNIDAKQQKKRKAEKKRHDKSDVNETEDRSTTEEPPTKKTPLPRQKQPPQVRVVRKLINLTLKLPAPPQKLGLILQDDLLHTPNHLPVITALRPNSTLRTVIPIHVINDYWITSIKDEVFGKAQIINSKSFLDELAKRRKDGNETIVELQFTLRTKSALQLRPSQLLTIGRRPKGKSLKQIAAWEKREKITPKHHYLDHAAVPTIDPSKVKHKVKGGVVVQFPVKLHAMLDEIEADGLAHVVSWQPHGRCFVVHKPKEFVHDVMPRYFKQTKLTSFQRQLNLYGFNRMMGGLDKGGYYHERFLRGKVGLAYDIQRKRVKGTGVRLPTPDNEPNFYALPPIIKDAAPLLRAAVTTLQPDPVARKKLQDEVTMMSKQDIISTNTSSRCKALSPTKVRAATKMSKSDVTSLRSRPQIPQGRQPVHSPHPHDVLSGRGGIVNSHPGNVYFRKIVDSNKREYLDPRIKRAEKTLITRRIVANVRSLEPNGRFLAKDLRSGCWIEIGDEKAWMKAGQALREGAPLTERENIIRGLDVAEDLDHPSTTVVGGKGVHEGKNSDDDEIEDRSTTEEPPTNKNRGMTPPESKEKHFMEMWSLIRKEISDLRKDLKNERDADAVKDLENDIRLLMKRKAEYAEQLGIKEDEMSIEALV